MSEDLGKLVLRLGLGAMILFHGVHKLLMGLDPVKELLIAHNMSSTLAYGVYLGELIAPIFVILGLFTRIGGLLIAAEMVAAVLLAGRAEALTIAPSGGYALELEVMYFAAALAVALCGAGRISLGGGRWN